MTVFITYCSAAKDPTTALLPAIDRYQSHRIAKVHGAANLLQLRFFILSGKYGLLEPSEEISLYDHLLVPEEVEAHSQKVASQIRAFGIEEITFFTLPPAKDPHLEAYIDCIRRAAEQSGVPFGVVLIPIAD